MPIPAGVRHVVMFGTLPGGEVWNSGFWINHQITDETSGHAEAEAMFTQLKTNSSGHFWYEARQHWFNPGTTFDGVRNYGYTAGGTTADFAVSSSSSGVTGGAVGGSNINQVALCVTLLTGYSGAHRRGRMFLPATGGVADGNGLFTNVMVQALLVGLLADMRACATIGGEPFDLIVVSRSLTGYRSLTSVRADLRPDVQERRANRQNRGTPQTAS